MRRTCVAGGARDRRRPARSRLPPARSGGLERGRRHLDRLRGDGAAPTTSPWCPLPPAGRISAAGTRSGARSGPDADGVAAVGHSHRDRLPQHAAALGRPDQALVGLGLKTSSRWRWTTRCWSPTWPRPGREAGGGGAQGQGRAPGHRVSRTITGPGAGSKAWCWPSASRSSASW